MAKGDYSSKWGGSLKGYEKGKKDERNNTVNKIFDFFGKVLDEYVKATKK